MGKTAQIKPENRPKSTETQPIAKEAPALKQAGVLNPDDEDEEDKGDDEYYDDEADSGAQEGDDTILKIRLLRSI